MMILSFILKMSLLSKTSLSIISYLFMAKIYFELKRYKASTATLGKAMSFKNIPEPIYMSMLRPMGVIESKKT